MILRQPSRLAVPLAIAGVLAAACGPAEFPVQPDAEPVFTAIRFDAEQALPAPSSPVLSARSTPYNYSFDVAYQRDGAHLERDSEAAIHFRIMLGDSTINEDGTWTWSGDAVLEDIVYVDGQTGEVNLSGTFSLPYTGPYYCDAYDLAAFWVRIEPADTVIDPVWYTAQVEHDDILYFGVTGTTATSCAEVQS